VCESNDSTSNSVYIPQPVNKYVLVEFISHAGCYPFIAEHHYLDQITDNTGSTINDTSVIILSYHTRYPFSFDVLYRANVEQNEYRSTTYYGVNFTPQCRIDGVNSGQFSASNWSAQINSELRSTRYLNISLSNSFNPNTDSGTVSANISLVSALPSSDNVIHIIITESNIPYPNAPNGITSPDDVMRYMITGKEGETINVGQNTTVTKPYGLNSAWNEDECYITVFVQSVSAKNTFGVERIKVKQ
jgi:hypothetical protein